LEALIGVDESREDVRDELVKLQRLVVRLGEGALIVG